MAQTDARTKSNDKVSVYNGVTDTKGISASMDSVVDRIRSGGRGLAEKTTELRSLNDNNGPAYDREKEKLPAVTWSGVFESRKAENLETHSGYIVLDIDNDIDVEEVKAQLTAHPNVAVLFISPSGQGVKPVIPVSPVPFTVEEHQAAFNAVLDVFTEYVVDDPVKLPAQRDPCRLCFLAHDPEVVDQRLTATPVSWEMQQQLTPPPKKKEHSPPSIEEARATLKRLDANDYARWIEIGMACKSAGLPIDVWEDWSKTASNYQPGVCQKKWDSFNKAGIGWGSVVRLSNESKQASTSPAPEDDLDLSPLPVGDTAILPVYPDHEGETFLGAFQALYQAYAKTHVWSPEMLMAMGIGVYSFIAKGTFVKTHDRANAMPLNSFILAVGESDLTAKSEALTEIKKIMYTVDHDFRPVSNVQSIEGLLTALNESDSPERYCLFDEGSVVFENTRRQGTKNLFSGLNELWLCPQTYSTARAAGVSKVVSPYVCCWANIPTKLIAAVFRHEDMIGGSLNRWLPFFISPKVKTERYPHAEAHPFDVWIKELYRVHDNSRSRTLTFTEDADDSRFAWFEGLRSKAIESGEQIGESRFHTHAVKLAGIFALAENDSIDDEVKLHHWEAALTVVRYLSDCAEYLFRNVGATRLGELENEVLDILAQHGNEMPLNALTQKTRRFDVEERLKLLDFLEQSKLIIRFTERTKGRPKLMIRRIS